MRLMYMAIIKDVTENLAANKTNNDNNMIIAGATTPKTALQFLKIMINKFANTTIINIFVIIILC